MSGVVIGLLAAIAIGMGLFGFGYCGSHYADRDAALAKYRSLESVAEKCIEAHIRRDECPLWELPQ